MNNHTKSHHRHYRNLYIKRRMKDIYGYGYFDYLFDDSLSEWEKKNEEIFHWHWKITSDYEKAKEFENREDFYFSSYVNSYSGIRYYQYSRKGQRYRRRPYLPGKLSKNRSFLYKHYESGKTREHGLSPNDTRRILSMKEEISEYFGEEIHSYQIERDLHIDSEYKWHD